MKNKWPNLGFLTKVGKINFADNKINKQINERFLF